VCETANDYWFKALPFVDEKGKKLSLLKLYYFMGGVFLTREF
jgi:hypothetical protein